jgi:hypothetical protein
VPNLLAGFLSGFVTMFVLRVFARQPPVQDSSAEVPGGKVPPKPNKAEAAQ